MCHHYGKDARTYPVDKALHRIVYGGEDFKNLPEFLYKKRFRDWNDTVKRVIPSDKLLVMDICRGDDYVKLCPFVGHPPVDEPFPHEYQTGPSA